MGVAGACPSTRGVRVRGAMGSQCTRMPRLARASPLKSAGLAAPGLARGTALRVGSGSPTSAVRAPVPIRVGAARDPRRNATLARPAVGISAARLALLCSSSGRAPRPTYSGHPTPPAVAAFHGWSYCAGGQAFSRGRFYGSGRGEKSNYTPYYPGAPDSFYRRYQIPLSTRFKAIMFQNVRRSETAVQTPAARRPDSPHARSGMGPQTRRGRLAAGRGPPARERAVGPSGAGPAGPRPGAAPPRAPEAGDLGGDLQRDGGAVPQGLVLGAQAVPALPGVLRRNTAPFTPEEDEALGRLFTAHPHAFAKIGAVLGRTDCQVRTRLRSLKLLGK
ncbi:Myb-like DNA-binding domain-containing protein [Spironucleus salmonicida]|uniref:Myb-like DNA-binding domain-containing protein n=1 Tax=Spironucleus salmonicida TaxID=348837 RepID=A0A9P8RXC7_9EUKA|nr:Myb-like DNA-binding domain-containing protein [Spironucleus salmonicida]